MKRITDRELEKVIGGVTLEIHSNTLPSENLAPPTQSTIEERNKQMSIRLSKLQTMSWRINLTSKLEVF